MEDSRYWAWKKFCEESDRQVADFNEKPQNRCPFCGGEAEAEAHGNYDGDYDPHFVIECKSCEARVKTYRFDEAVKQWNRRVESGAPLKYRFEYCVQFRHQRTNEPWRVIKWSIGPLKRARELLKIMLADNNYRQYEYRVAVHRLTDWEVR